MSAFIRKNAIVFLWVLGLAINLFALIKIFYWQTQVINPDGVCYLSSAELFLKGDFFSGVRICPQAHWPFYSMLLAMTAKLFHFSIEISTIIWQLVFFSFIYLGFLKLLQTLNADQKTQCFGFALIVLSPVLIHVRDQIIRDLGFWACFLWAMWAFIQCLEKTTWMSILKFWSLILLACLFRIEGLFLTLVPLGIFLISNNEAALQRQSSVDAIKTFDKKKMVFQLYIFPLLLLIFSAIYFVKFNHLKWISQLRWGDLLFQMNHGMQLLKLHFFAFPAPHENLVTQFIFSLGAYGFWYILLCVSTMSWVISAFFALAYRQKVLKLNSISAIGINAFLFVHFFITFVFLIQNLFLSERYLTPIILILMLLIPFLLSEFSNSHSKKQLKSMAIYAFFIWLGLAASVALFRSEKVIPMAGSFLKSKMVKTIYTNDLRVLYYAGIPAHLIYEDKKYVWNAMPDHFVLKAGECIAWVVSRKTANAFKVNSNTILSKQFCTLRQCVNVYEKKGEQ